MQTFSINRAKLDEKSWIKFTDNRTFNERQFLRFLCKNILKL